MIWKIGRFLHKHVRDEYFWKLWWFLGYRWIYPFMYSAKQKGYKFAQPFGEGY